MPVLGSVLSLLFLAGPSPAPPVPTARATPEAAPPRGPVVLFLVDNSASLPPLDPEEKRVAALERMLGFVGELPSRLVLFGARRENAVDEAQRYNNRGQWTDFFYALETARAVVREYPAGTEFRLILVTDGLLDPDPEEWRDDPAAPRDPARLRSHVAERSVALARDLGQPLYVILVGDPPADAVAGHAEQAPPLVLELVRAANGVAAAPRLQSVAGFFRDDGLLFKKFVYRVAPGQGLRRIEPVVRRIVAPSRPAVELQFLTGLVLPLTLFLFLLLGILVRSFPGPGDTEAIDLALGVPLHLACDRLHKLDSGGWGSLGLSLVGNVREAAATLSYQRPALDLTGSGLATEALDLRTRSLLPLGLEDLRKSLEAYVDSGSKEEKIYALNLDYLGKGFDPALAERLLSTPAAERRRVPALDFFRAKVHLLSNDELRRRLTDPRVQLAGYGKRAERTLLAPGATARIGRYGFVVEELLRGGRKDARLVLRYESVPSLFGLKRLLPRAFQRLFRLRRSQQRLIG